MPEEASSTDRTLAAQIRETRGARRQDAHLVATIQRHLKTRRAEGVLWDTVADALDRHPIADDGRLRRLLAGGYQAVAAWASRAQDANETIELTRYQTPAIYTIPARRGPRFRREHLTTTIERNPHALSGLATNPRQRLAQPAALRLAAQVVSDAGTVARLSASSGREPRDITMTLAAQMLELARAGGRLPVKQREACLRRMATRADAVGVLREHWHAAGLALLEDPTLPSSTVLWLSRVMESHISAIAAIVHPAVDADAVRHIMESVGTGTIGSELASHRAIWQKPAVVQQLEHLGSAHILLTLAKHAPERDAIRLTARAMQVAPTTVLRAYRRGQCPWVTQLPPEAFAEAMQSSNGSTRASAFHALGERTTAPSPVR